MRGNAIRRVGAFGAEPSRETESFERSVATKLRQNDLDAFGPFTVTALQTATYPAKPWELVRCNPTAGAFTVFLPDANASDSGAIIVANDSASITAITIQPLNTTSTVNGTTSISIISARGSVTLFPDPASNNWIAISGSTALTLAGDVDGASNANTVRKIQGTSVSTTAPTTRQVLLFDGSSWVPTSGMPGLPLAPAVSLAFKTTAGTVDATAYTVPASPTGNNRFSLHRLRVRLKTAISGTGSVVIRAGTSVGGNDVLVDSASWTSATSAGTEIGISIADFGTAFLAATGYVAELSAAAVLSVRATTTGTLSAGDVEIFTYGAYAS